MKDTQLHLIINRITPLKPFLCMIFLRDASHQVKEIVEERPDAIVHFTLHLERRAITKAPPNNSCLEQKRPALILAK